MTLSAAPRLRLIEPVASERREHFHNIVAEGLSALPKKLPCRFFYDTDGSHIFEQICLLPEYYLTRTEQSIFERCALEIVEAAGSDISLVEFGSGSSCKTRLLIEALFDRQQHLHYIPIDISRDFLHGSARNLLQDYDLLNITAIAAEYNDGILAVPESPESRLFLFLGSNIGNFDPVEAVGFLKRIRARMKSSDRLLLGVDLLKDRTILEAAYNDKIGVTAAFNKNLLHRCNRELGSNFEPEMFEHSAPFVDSPSRIEMRLFSKRRQTVHIKAMSRDFHFAEGEYIHTENSHKYSPDAILKVCHAAGLELDARWMDEREWFAALLLKPDISIS